MLVFILWLLMVPHWTVDGRRRGCYVRVAFIRIRPRSKPGDKAIPEQPVNLLLHPTAALAPHLPLKINGLVFAQTPSFANIEPLPQPWLQRKLPPCFRRSRRV